ncbi:MAG TPA: DUF2911 domain-containing protein [Acidobacteriota bacterium]|nr:DUF2911 domain-containing protein [Acidobacteriota bacterium]
MKSFIALAVLLGIASLAIAQVDIPRVSPKASVSQVIGLTEVKITYSRPGVKNRTIWGGLVPYDKVWRTGANEATTFTTSTDVKVEGQPLTAGTYALFTIPGKTEWTIIFNKTADQFGAFEYKQDQDVLRVKVKPDTASPQEWMGFAFQNLSLDSADVVLRWEKLQVKFGIQVDTANKVFASCRSAMAGLKADDSRTPYRCANFALDNKGDEKEAMAWLEKSLSIKEDFFNLELKANTLAKAGKKAEALEAAKKALTLTKDVPEEDVAGLKKKVEEWSASK